MCVIVFSRRHRPRTPFGMGVSHKIPLFLISRCPHYQILYMQLLISFTRDCFEIHSLSFGGIQAHSITRDALHSTYVLLCDRLLCIVCFISHYMTIRLLSLDKMRVSNHYNTYFNPADTHNYKFIIV